MASTCWVSYYFLTPDTADPFSYRRRPSESLHQEDYVTTEQVDGRRQNLKTCRGDYKQGDWGARGKMAV